MPDQKPPRLVDDERSTLQALLQFQRESFVRKVSGVDESAARHSPVASGTSLLWLAEHLAQAEASWVLDRFAGQDGPFPDDDVQPDDTLTAAIDEYRATCARVDAVVADAADLDEVCRRLDGNPPVSLRWILMHLLEETARHAGHADIIRELLDGSTGR